MADLFQDLAKMKILLISAYEELLKEGKIAEDEFEALLSLLDKLDHSSQAELEAELHRIFPLKEGE